MGKKKPTRKEPPKDGAPGCDVVPNAGAADESFCERAAAYSSTDSKLNGWASWFGENTSPNVCAEHAGVLMHYGISCEPLK